MNPIETYRWKLLWLLVPLTLGVGCLWLILSWDSAPERRTLPDMRAISDVTERKQIFIDFLLPAIEERNEEIAKQRAELRQLQTSYQQNGALTPSESVTLERLAKRVRLDVALEDAAFWELMLRRLDQLPPSLVLAQAANESGWGTSRFAREGNNFFGQWCFVEGCGIVPARRAEGMSHEVAAFDTPRQAIASYFRNLNTHNAYKELRAMRRRARETQSGLSGLRLAEGLLRYSERGEEYVEELQSMIRFNEFDRFDEQLNRSDESESPALAAE